MDVLFIPLCASVGEEGPAMNYRERGRRNLSGRTAEDRGRRKPCGKPQGTVAEMTISVDKEDAP